MSSVSKKGQFITDGLIATGVGVVLPAGIAGLCKPGGIICEFFQHVFDFFLQPYEYIVMGLNGTIANAIRAVHNASYNSSGLEIGDYFLIGLGILEYLLYWFVAGVVICGIWRAVRTQVQTLLTHRLG